MAWNRLQPARAMNVMAEPRLKQPQEQAPATAPVEWLASAAPVPYPEALAVMDARADAIARGAARECVWLLEHPPLYTAGTSADASELLDATRFPVLQDRPRRALHLSRPWPARGLCDARPVAARTRRAGLRHRARGLADRDARPPRRRGRAAPRRGRHLRRRRQDREHRGTRAPLGEPARRQPQRLSRARAFLGHRALRARRCRR